jgi:hypothetical protein
MDIATECTLIDLEIKKLHLKKNALLKRADEYTRNKLYCDEFAALTERSCEISKMNEWGDPFNYNRAREIHLAHALGHRVASTYAGADAFDEHGTPIEYKSTIQKNVKGTYNGISVKESWEEQIWYLVNEKIGKYTHFIALYDSMNIVKCYKLKGSDVLNILLPKLKKQWIRLKLNMKVKSDPRLGAVLTKREIEKYGELIILNQV